MKNIRPLVIQTQRTRQHHVLPAPLPRARPPCSDLGSHRWAIEKMRVTGMAGRRPLRNGVLLLPVAPMQLGGCGANTAGHRCCRHTVRLWCCRNSAKQGHAPAHLPLEPSRTHLSRCTERWCRHLIQKAPRMLRGIMRLACLQMLLGHGYTGIAAVRCPVSVVAVHALGIAQAVRVAKHGLLLPIQSSPRDVFIHTLKPRTCRDAMNAAKSTRPATNHCTTATTYCCASSSSSSNSSCLPTAPLRLATVPCPPSQNQELKATTCAFLRACAAVHVRACPSVTQPCAAEQPPCE